MTEKPASDKTQMATYADLVARIAELEAVLDCRAGRLLLKRATFVVVRDDEPYYCQVYRLIRDHERAIGRWTDCDEVYFVRQCGGDTDTRAALEREEILHTAFDTQSARIAELEAALEGLLNHTKNNQQICGLNDRARAALHKEGK